jgi:hypothetical protein
MDQLAQSIDQVDQGAFMIESVPVRHAAMTDHFGDIIKYRGIHPCITGKKGIVGSGKGHQYGTYKNTYVYNRFLSFQ